MLQPGQRIGNYEVLAPLGAGGMAGPHEVVGEADQPTDDT